MRETVRVPIVELKKLEKARKDLYKYLGDHVSSVTMQKLTERIWKVANTKKWE